MSVVMPGHRKLPVCAVTGQRRHRIEKNIFAICGKRTHVPLKFALCCELAGRARPGKATAPTVTSLCLLRSPNHARQNAQKSLAVTATSSRTCFVRSTRPNHAAPSAATRTDSSRHASCRSYFAKSAPALLGYLSALPEADSQAPSRLTACLQRHH